MPSCQCDEALLGVAALTQSRPRNLGASIRQRLLDLARKKSEVFDLVLTRYALEQTREKRLSFKKPCCLFEHLMNTWLLAGCNSAFGVFMMGKTLKAREMWSVIITEYKTVLCILKMIAIA